MRCPKCEKNTKVLDSRVIGEKRIRRRYCKTCGYEMYTSEQKMDYLEGMTLINDFYRKHWKSKEGV